MSDVVRIPGYRTGDDLGGEPVDWLCVNEAGERWIEPNPAYVPSPPLSERERLQEAVCDARLELRRARAALAAHVEGPT